MHRLQTRGRVMSNVVKMPVDEAVDHLKNVTPETKDVIACVTLQAITVDDGALTSELYINMKAVPENVNMEQLAPQVVSGVYESLKTIPYLQVLQHNSTSKYPSFLNLHSSNILQIDILKIEQAV